jgi:signal peptidase I
MTKDEFKREVKEWISSIFVALVLTLIIRTYVIQAFKIPSGSMLPTLEIGDHILVNKFIYGARIEIPLTQYSLGQLPGLRAPRQGDVVVFIPPKQRELDYIKRIVATEGQTIEVRNNQVYVDGQPWNDPHARFAQDPPEAPRPSRPQPCGSVSQMARATDCAPFTVPKGHVFAMGDNRDQSYDSRFWGPVPVEDIKGLALVIYWSWGGPNWVRWERLARLVS